ncbi:hypothetical protein BKP35_14790 [Anaerobacillus arseniciselenatis]|uniref:Uncharacterized protein n=1 Tax=Anaerobacillus arseniciselenatis TaxID=85682 RepID=A0A1S2LBM5_9BACI|nr:hypothetical protein [Anaerobacillus arseniciselenatis]OIJ09756.1 hypothetical protein BKP35_14790 [Anaerobacillus arseniciselenatis]
MKQVVQSVKKADCETRIAVLRLEIDYELATLHDAMVVEDLNKINECKKRLERFRQELYTLLKRIKK